MYKSLPGFIYLYSWRTRRATSIGFLVLACGPHDIDWPWQWLACGPPMCAAYGSDWPAGRLVVAGLRAVWQWLACGPPMCASCGSDWPAGRLCAPLVAVTGLRAVWWWLACGPRCGGRPAGRSGVAANCFAVAGLRAASSLRAAWSNHRGPWATRYWFHIYIYIYIISEGFLK